MESNLANKGIKFNSEFISFIQQVCWVPIEGNIVLGTKFTALNKIYIVPALMGPMGLDRGQQTFPVKDGVINI